jgi:hypothetical protein
MSDPWLTTAVNGRMQCRGLPFGPEFADQKDCEDFIQYVANRTGLDPRQQSDEWIERIAESWVTE